MWTHNLEFKVWKVKKALQRFLIKCEKSQTQMEHLKYIYLKLANSKDIGKRKNTETNTSEDK
jgi:hypothetical protein